MPNVLLIPFSVFFLLEVIFFICRISTWFLLKMTLHHVCVFYHRLNDLVCKFHHFCHLWCDHSFYVFTWLDHIGGARIWLNGILGVSMTLVLDEINIWVVGWVKHTVLPNVGGPTQPVEVLNRRKGPVKENSLFLPVFKTGHPFFLPLDSDSDGNPHHRLSWVSSLPTAAFGTFQPP